MPMSIVVGGQYGSEGKGKVALEIARRHGPDIVAMRVGGPNSGHIAYDRSGTRRVFRQIPVCAADGASLVVLPPGSYLDVPLLLREAAELGLGCGRLRIDPRARIVTDEHRRWEADAGLTQGIGSTGSGTGAAVIASLGMPVDGLPDVRAADVKDLEDHLSDTLPLLRSELARGRRLVAEGTQGFGLSINHGPWPKVTSRDTTAAAVLSECGLSPFDVDDVTMVIRCHPIRVAGASGPLEGETSWDEIAGEASADRDVTEMTTVTGRVRRVGRFDAELVRRALRVNQPTRLVLNHLDYVDWRVRDGVITDKARAFIDLVEAETGRRVDWVGVDERTFVDLTGA